MSEQTTKPLPEQINYYIKTGIRIFVLVVVIYVVLKLVISVLGML